MWVLQNFPEHLLLQNTSGGCFCIYWFDAWKNQNQSIKYVLRQKQLTSETFTLISLILTEIYMEILRHIWNRYRSSHQKCCLKKVFLKISENVLENTCKGVSFLKKLQVKKEIPTQFFPMNLTIFRRTTFYRTPPRDCFCHEEIAAKYCFCNEVNLNKLINKFVLP